MQLAQRLVRVAVNAADVISCAGITEYLKTRPEVEVLPLNRRPEADVIVLAPERLTSNAFVAMRKEARGSTQPAVLVADRISQSDLPIAMECRIIAVLPRSAAADERLLKSVLATAARKGLRPPDLLGELLAHTEQLQTETLTSCGLKGGGLSPREVDVLRLMSEGLDTAEIAKELCYSQRTIKNLVYTCTSRLNLRNRPHAVAYAMRAGVI